MKAYGSSRRKAQQGMVETIDIIRRLYSIYMQRFQHVEREMRFENVSEKDPVKRYGMCEQTHKHTNRHTDILTTCISTYKHR